MYAEALRSNFATTVIVENRPGAGGIIAYEYVKNSGVGDGSLMFLSPAYPIVISPHVARNLPYDTLRDFVPVGVAGRSMLTFAVGPAVPASVTTLADYVQWVRQDPARTVYAAQNGSSLGVLALAMKTAPDYKSARWDPTINRCFRTVVGYEDATSTVEHLCAIDKGLLPKPAAALRVNSLWDKSQAPADHHVAGGDVLMPSPHALDMDTWAAVAGSYVSAFVDAWAQYAPNISQASVTAGTFAPPQHYDRSIRLREGSAQYRTEVGQLYLCGASTFPGGGVHGACGYNAFKAIAEDIGLAKPQ